MIGTGEVDITYEMASYGRKQRRTPSSTNTVESEAAKDSQKYVGDGSYAHESDKAGKWILSHMMQ